MGDILTSAVQIITIASATCTLLYKVTLKPMNVRFDNLIHSIDEKVDALGESVDKLNTSIDRMNDKLTSFDVRLARVEEPTKSAHHRLDGLEKKIG